VWVFHRLPRFLSGGIDSALTAVVIAADALGSKCPRLDDAEPLPSRAAWRIFLARRKIGDPLRRGLQHLRSFDSVKAAMVLF
jgi:NH3-dependent NAD+ synthetase